MEVKEMVARVRAAQKQFEQSFDQQSVDRVVRAIGKVVYNHAEMLSRMACDESRMGVYEDKVAKCKGKSKAIWHDLRGKKSTGILSIDDYTGLIEIAKPVGVVCGVVPCTNPVVTPMSNIMFALKTLNGIIIAPHPRTKGVSALTCKMIKEAICPMGVPEDLIMCIEEPSIDTTNELMRTVDVCIATGGMAMVKAAYSSGKPSFGVGAGNVQVILDRHINFDEAAAKIVAGRKFDNGIICTGEQSFIYPRESREEVLNAFTKNGAYIVPMADKKAVIDAIFDGGIDGHTAGDVVGQSPEFIAKKAGINIPANTKILVVEGEGYGRDEMISKEKMCPVMGAFPYEHFEEAIHIAKTNLELEGNGHSVAIHSKDQGHIIDAGTKLTVSRLVVNATCATNGGGSIQNGLAVTNTLGCGSWGNNSISENFTYKHLMNITRIAPISTRMPLPTDEEIWAAE